MNRNFVVISGISGAGKTVASNFLEDMGYYCLEGFPSDLLKQFVELLDDKKYEKVAITIPLSDLEKYINFLNSASINFKLVLISAKQDVIIERYKFSRRIHPLVALNKASSLDEAYLMEKVIVDKFKQEASVIDTSKLSLIDHKKKLASILYISSFSKTIVTFQSFGFMYQIPSDSDLVFDVRFLKNPFYDSKLKTLTGNSKEVYDYVINDTKTQRYLKKLTSYLDFTLSSYNKMEKRHITISIGCTGGQHRSVSIANYLFRYYKDQYSCLIEHVQVGNKK